MFRLDPSDASCQDTPAQDWRTSRIAELEATTRLQQERLISLQRECARLRDNRNRLADGLMHVVTQGLLQMPACPN